MSRLIDLAACRRARALGEYWDHVVRRLPAEDPSQPDGDPELADVIRRIQQVSDAGQTQPWFGDSIPPTTTHPSSVDEHHVGVNRVSTHIAPARPTGDGPPSSSLLPGDSWSRWASIALSAAMLMVAVTFLVNPTRPVRNWLDDRNEPSGFAIYAPGTPEPSAGETLLTLTLANDAIPRDEGSSAGLFLLPFSPGYRWTRAPGCCPGPLVEYVLQGAYSVQAEASMRVLRADGVAEDVAAGKEVVLNAGDALVSRMETGAAMESAGSEPLRLLSWVLIGPGEFMGLVPRDIQAYPIDAQGPLTIPPGAVFLRLRSVELEAGAALPATSTSTLLFAVTSPSNAFGTPVAPATRNEDGSIKSTSRQAATVYILTLEPVSAGSGTPVEGTPTP